MADSEYVSSLALARYPMDDANDDFYPERRGGCRYVLNQLPSLPSLEYSQANQSLEIFGWKAWRNDTNDGRWARGRNDLNAGDRRIRRTRTQIADDMFGQ